MTSSLNALVHAAAAFVGDATGAAKTATYTSTGVDVQDYEGQLGVLQLVGAVSGTTPTLDGKLQDSDAIGGTYADIPGAVFAQATTAGNIQKITVDLNGCKRFIRYVGTIAGTTPSFGIAVAVVGPKKYQ